MTSRLLESAFLCPFFVRIKLSKCIFLYNARQLRYNPAFIRQLPLSAMSHLSLAPIDDAISAQYRRIIRKRVLLVLISVLAIIGSLLLDFTLGPS